MDATALIERLHAHRTWVSARLLDAAATLSDSQLREPHPIGQGSVWKSLLHMVAAEYVWLAALEGDADPAMPGDRHGELPGNQLDGGIGSVAELHAAWADLDRRWSAYLGGLTAASLAETVTKVSTSSGRGRAWGTSRGDVLLHVCTHTHYTAAQVNNMLRRSGAAVPDVMLITLARGESVGECYIATFIDSLQKFDCAPTAGSRSFLPISFWGRRRPNRPTPGSCAVVSAHDDPKRPGRSPQPRAKERLEVAKDRTRYASRFQPKESTFAYPRPTA